MILVVVEDWGSGGWEWVLGGDCGVVVAVELELELVEWGEEEEKMVGLCEDED